MTPDEVMRLRPPVKAGHGESERIVAPGDMLIFISGHYPIYGKQVLYFADPEFVKRAAEPSPTSFYAIEEGSVRRQRPLDRAANVLSRAELLPVEDSTVSSTNGADFLDDASIFDAYETGAIAPATARSGSPGGGFIEQLNLDRQMNVRKVPSAHEKEL
jgi:hypothetical protein